MCDGHFNSKRRSEGTTEIAVAIFRIMPYVLPLTYPDALGVWRSTDLGMRVALLAGMVVYWLALALVESCEREWMWAADARIRQMAAIGIIALLPGYLPIPLYEAIHSWQVGAMNHVHEYESVNGEAMQGLREQSSDLLLVMLVFSLVALLLLFLCPPLGGCLGLILLLMVPSCVSVHSQLQAHREDLGREHWLATGVGVSVTVKCFALSRLPIRIRSITRPLTCLTGLAMGPPIIAFVTPGHHAPITCGLVKMVDGTWPSLHDAEPAIALVLFFVTFFFVARVYVKDR